MTTDTELETRLADYGDVLRAQLNGAPESDDQTGTLLIGGFAGTHADAATKTRSRGAILSMAAAAVVVLGLLIPTLTMGDSNEPIRVVDSTADQPDATNDGEGGRDGAGIDETGKSGAGVDEVRDNDAEGDPVGSTSDSSNAGDSSTTGDAADPTTYDWSAFSVQVGDQNTNNSIDDDDAPDSENDEADEDDKEDKGNDDQDSPDKDDQDNDNKDRNETDADGTDTDGKDEQSTTCPAGAVKRSGSCVIVGTAPTNGSADCPDDAVEVGSQCYEVVAPTCGELEPAPGGDGCLKLVGSAAASGRCPSAYQLDGDTCIKLIAASATCNEGTTQGDGCLLKTAPIGGDSGCSAGDLQLGQQCYELSSPTGDCGEMVTLPEGGCRYPVGAEQSYECPAGTEPLSGDTCYRYEDAILSCDAGELDGAWCTITEAATPGPDVCDDGVLQDDQGCYVLYDIHEDGTCGGLPEFEGKCRQEKTSYPTWECEGEVVYEATCERWEEAHADCANGDLVSATECKIIESAIASESCPSYALEDSSGCYKAKEASVHCGELDVAPDGEKCKRWVGEAAAGAECPASYELVGDFCKKFIEATGHTCSDGQLVEIDGQAKCRFSKPATGEGDTGCQAGAIEKNGECYQVVAASCANLDLDLYGSGCKKLIETDGKDLVCEAGFELAANECVKKV